MAVKKEIQVHMYTTCSYTIYNTIFLERLQLTLVYYTVEKGKLWIL